MSGLYNGGTGLYNGTVGLLYGTGLSTPPGLLADAAFSPISLFTGGIQGAWYDPSDLTTMFQDSAGTTPVTAVEQPVGLILDKSKNLQVGAEIVTNGDFSNGSTGWTLEAVWTVSAGAATYTSGSAGNSIYQTVSLQAGKSYRVTFSITARSGSSAVQATASGIESSGDFTSTGNKSCILRPAANRTQILFYASGAGSLTIDNISVKEIAGNHASQSTSASRPVLSARYNLLTYTEQFDNAAWFKGGISISANTTVAPDGTTTADTCTTSTTTPAIYQSVTAPASSLTYSIYAKTGTGVTKPTLEFLVRNNTTSTNFDTGTFDTVTGAITGSGWTSAAVGGGWYLVSYTRSTGINAGNTLYVYAGWTGAVTTSGQTWVVWGADLRVTNDGIGLPAYQRVVDSTTYDAGDQWPRYLRFDGTDDSLATSAIDFSGTDKMTVFAGVRKLSDAAQSSVFSLSSNVNSNTGSFEIQGPSSATSNYRFACRANTSVPYRDATTFTAPISNVLSALFDVSKTSISAQIVPRVNGATPSLADTGTPDTISAFGNYPLYIGRRGGSTLPFNGRLYSLIVRGAASSDTQIANAEKWVNGKTGAY